MLSEHQIVEILYSIPFIIILKTYKGVSQQEWKIEETKKRTATEKRNKRNFYNNS